MDERCFAFLSINIPQMVVYWGRLDLSSVKLKNLNCAVGQLRSCGKWRKCFDKVKILRALERVKFECLQAGGATHHSILSGSSRVEQPDHYLGKN